MARTAPVESLNFVPNMGEKPISYKAFRRVLTAPAVTPVSEREFRDTAEMAAFMEELVIIRMHTTTDVNAEPFVPVGCNGEQTWLPRGVPIEIPRKFIESLTGLTVSFRTERVQDPNAEEGFVQRASASQAYPFEILSDPNPKGRAWLARVLRGG